MRRIEEALGRALHCLDTAEVAAGCRAARSDNNDDLRGGGGGYGGDDGRPLIDAILQGHGRRISRGLGLSSVSGSQRVRRGDEAGGTARDTHERRLPMVRKPSSPFMSNITQKRLSELLEHIDAFLDQLDELSGKVI